MKSILLSAILIGVCSPALLGQQAETRSSAQGRADAATGTLQSGTRLSGELQNAIDVRKAKVGDQVVLKTTQAVKSQGQTVVPKGARLLGHVTGVTQKSKSESNSSVSILFDSINSGSLDIPITATINSLTGARAASRVNNDDAEFRMESQSRTSTQASRSNGGLVGGVTNTVGGVVNTTTSAAGSVVGGTTSAVGSSVDAVRNTGLGSIQISESSNASVEGGSTLSLAGDNLKLEKGTTFNLNISQSGSVRSPNQD